MDYALPLAIGQELALAQADAQAGSALGSVFGSILGCPLFLKSVA
jgi:hypothetical protein